MKKAFLILFSSILLCFTTSCNDTIESGPSIIASGLISLNTENEIPIVEDRDETGSFQLNLYDDHIIEFLITVNDLTSLDELTVAHIHTGDPVSVGAPAITLVDGISISFQGNQATGTIQLTEAEAATLLGDDVYINVHSTEQPNGLVRGQLDKIIDRAYNVKLSPENEIPAITDRDDSGTAIFRTVQNQSGTTELYYRVDVMNLEASDAITAGHIHNGDASVNGDVFKNLELTDATQLGITKTITLESHEVTTLINDALYVNVHSTDYAGGLMRGQIRD